MKVQERSRTDMEIPSLEETQSGDMPGLETFGMAVLVASLSILFMAGILVYLLIRARQNSWPPEGIQRLPSALWVSSGVLLASSVTMHIAQSSARRNHDAALRTSISLTTLLGAAFLCNQAYVWFLLNRGGFAASKINLYIFGFYTLSGLHGAHVIAGLLWLSIVTVKVYRGKFDGGRYEGVRNCAIFWHFLDAAWLSLFLIVFVLR